jgi:hypothetical protein
MSLKPRLDSLSAQASRYLATTEDYPTWFASENRLG